MDKKKWLKLIQHHVTNASIGPTTLRNQGPEGTTDAARKFLARLRLCALTKKPATEYHGWLNKKTRRLMKQFPRGAQGNWGAARKAINVFMKEAYFNKVLAPEYELHQLKNVLEVPLDKYNAVAIKRYAKNKLCQLRSIKKLDQKTSERYQNKATKLAQKRGLPRGELDIVLWPEGRGERRKRKQISRRKCRFRKRGSKT